MEADESPFSLNYLHAPPRHPYDESPTFTGVKKALIISFLILSGTTGIGFCVLGLLGVKWL